MPLTCDLCGEPTRVTLQLRDGESKPQVCDSCRNGDTWVSRTEPLANRILQGDALTVLRTLPEGCVHLVVTSPPYWSLRDYSAPGQLGQEPLHDCQGWATGQSCGECYVCHLVQVFAEVWRVLRDDGVLIVNLGDGYASGDGGRQGLTGLPGFSARCAAQRKRSLIAGGLKPKNLCAIPWRVALALQADGWTLRSAIPWVKTNPMPESCQDRPTTSHEYLFMFAKGPRYYWDPIAISVPGKPYQVKEPDGWDVGPGAHGTVHRSGRSKGRRLDEIRVGRNRRTGDWTRESMQGAALGLLLQGARLMAILEEGGLALDDNGDPLALLVNPEPLKAAHFAAFPSRLVEPFVLAGTSQAGVCPECGAPWVRVVQRGNSEHHCRPGCGCQGKGQNWGEGWQKYGGFTNTARPIADNTGPRRATRKHDQTRLNTLAGSEYQKWAEANPKQTTGFRPSCACHKRTDCPGCGGRGWKVRNPLAAMRERRRAIVAALRAGTEPPKPTGRRKVWCPWCLGAGYPREEWGDTVPPIVLDPFMGAGTTANVAKKHGRSYLGIELNPEYIAIAQARIDEPSPEAAEYEAAEKAGQMTLFDEQDAAPAATTSPA